ncbi:nodulation protein NfeD [Nitrogeniibacter mangrovi]|uniref:Nodulation protein NfeD n=1 Tax=Nitrogeniibacter mangrovi TaxID=2016596 RepID=A0A6C1B063_9RHOO|nr:nodulation protein NfeD [Nitrogeniibacter mangrovi]QID16285.1 nodulation protein NfeD [Nitrogeniibacter mangrovi]
MRTKTGKTPWRHWLAAWLLALAGFVLPAHAGTVRVLTVDGVIGPASAEFIIGNLNPAPDLEAVVIALDTPGGLDSSMRQIIKAILASPVPVVTYVHPEGARAASAGTFILYASHIAAMTPATNLGAASPVAMGGLPGGGGGDAPAKGDAPKAGGDTGDTIRPSLGGDTLARKATNDAIAYIRSLAELRGRNAEFAEKAVREAASLSATAALREGVIDLIAPDVPTLLARIDGRSLKLANGTHVLKTRGASIDYRSPDWRIKLLAVLANPQLAVVLMMIGFYGLFVEFTSPGFGVPGVAGAICLLLALYALQMLPINWAGVGLIVFGMILMGAEVFMPSFGVLGVGGIIAFMLGGLFLMDREAPGFGVSMPFLAGTAIAAAGLIFLAGNLLVRSRERPVTSGQESLIGSTGQIVRREDGTLWAHVQGELWQVRNPAGLADGARIRVTGLDGLILSVTTLDSDHGSPS